MKGLSPLYKLSGGYAYVADEDGNNIDIVRHPKQVVKMRVDTKLYPSDMMRIKNVLTK